MAENIVSGADEACFQRSIAIQPSVHPIGVPFRPPYEGADLAGFLSGLAVMRKADLLHTAQIIEFHPRMSHAQAEEK